jgi:putative ABC transport system permease protein
MLKGYLTIFIRILMRQKVYSFINIFALAIGFAASLLIGCQLFSLEDLEFLTNQGNPGIIIPASLLPTNS